MEFYPIRQIQSNRLLAGCLERNFFCPLLFAVHIGTYISIGKGHLHIRNIRLAHSIVIKFLCQRFPGTVGSIEGIYASIGIGGCQMGNNKPFAGRKIRMVMIKEIGRSGSFRPVITYLCQFPVSFQFCDLVSTAPRPRL